MNRCFAFGLGLLMGAAVVWDARGEAEPPAEVPARSLSRVLDGLSLDLPQKASDYAQDSANPHVSVTGEPMPWFANPVAETSLVEMTVEARAELLDTLTAFAFERWSATNAELEVTEPLRAHVRDTLEAALFTDRAAWERWRQRAVPTPKARGLKSGEWEVYLPAKALPDVVAEQVWSPAMTERWRRNGPVAIGTDWHASAAEGALMTIPTGRGAMWKGIGWRPVPGPSAMVFPEKRWSRRPLHLLVPVKFNSGITEFVRFTWDEDRSTGRAWLVAVTNYYDSATMEDKPYHFHAFGFF